MKRSPGFSLIEIVLVLGLTSVILSTVSLLVQRTVETLHHLQAKSEAIQGATLGCERLCSELREAINTPTVGTSLRFRKVVPSSPRAIGNAQRPAPYLPPAPPPPPPAVPSHLWTRDYPAVYAPAQGGQMQVTYSVSPDPNVATLLRQVDSDPASVVASNVTVFTVELVARRTYRANLSIRERRRVVTFSAAVHCPGVP